MTRIPIYVIETDVAVGLPSERVYSTNRVGEPIGQIVLPEGMTAILRDEHIRFEYTAIPKKRSSHVFTLAVRYAVQYAIHGDHGLSFENETLAKIRGNGEDKSEGIKA